MRYGGRLLHVTELSFKKNLCCFVVGSISLYSNYLVKVLLPSHFMITTTKIEIGKFRFDFTKRKIVDNNEREGSLMDSTKSLPPVPNFELMSLQFCSFLVKKKGNNQIYSYMDPLETMKSYESPEESSE